jgi:ABC-type uncharacterized transport system ATPase subunit
VRSLLLQAKRDGAGVVFSTHQLAFAIGLADRLLVLDDGRVVDQGAFDAVRAGTEATRLGLR